MNGVLSNIKKKEEKKGDAYETKRRPTDELIIELQTGWYRRKISKKELKSEKKDKRKNLAEQRSPYSTKIISI